jgi:hypothetical protein
MQEHEWLQAEGRLHNRLLEVDRCGKANGWDGGAPSGVEKGPCEGMRQAQCGNG